MGTYSTYCVGRAAQSSLRGGGRRGRCCAVFCSAGAALSPRPLRVVSAAFKVTTVTLPELSLALRGMSSSRASGDDGVTVQMLRATFPVIGPHLLHVINSSLRTGEVPLKWKEASVVPLFKKGDRSDPVNFRPISINSVPGKLCENVSAINFRHTSTKTMYTPRHALW